MNSRNTTVRIIRPLVGEKKTAVIARRVGDPYQPRRRARRDARTVASAWIVAMMAAIVALAFSVGGWQR